MDTCHRKTTITTDMCSFLPQIYGGECLCVPHTCHLSWVNFSRAFSVRFKELQLTQQKRQQGGSRDLGRGGIHCPHFTSHGLILVSKWGASLKERMHFNCVLWCPWKTGLWCCAVSMCFLAPVSVSLLHIPTQCWMTFWHADPRGRLSHQRGMKNIFPFVSTESRMSVHSMCVAWWHD